MIFLYNIGIALYGGLLRIASLFNSKARKWIDGRSSDYFSLLESKIQPFPNPVWFHCASLGEFEQARPIIEAHRDRFPDTPILLTFFSPSGYEVRKGYTGADIVEYMPLDTPKNARKFISITKPKAVIFVKYEFWINHLKSAIDLGIPTYLISGIFRENQIFFKPFGRLHRRVIRGFEMLFVQDENSQKLLSRIDVNNTVIAGDTRFDRVWEIAQSPHFDPILEHFREHFTIVAGSTWPVDESFIAEWLNEDITRHAIIAPHEIRENHIRELLGNIKDAKRYSDGTLNSRVLIIDSIGMLSKIYRYGKVAYIGGGFGVGLHNTIEAAAYGIPVIFGPNHKKFVEAKALASNGGGLPIDSADGFKSGVYSLQHNAQRYAQASEQARKYVEENRGATDAFFEKYIL